MGEVSYVEVFSDDTGKSRGCGIIEFTSNELVDMALEKMHRYDLNGRKIVVKEVGGLTLSCVRMLLLWFSNNYDHMHSS